MIIFVSRFCEFLLPFKITITSQTNFSQGNAEEQMQSVSEYVNQCFVGSLALAV